MSYETDRLQQEINSIKWQKAENYKLERLETTVRYLKELITTLQNEKSYLQERIQTLEDRLNQNGG
jgi:predicted  nucleic acid-binding Zn-ribbon protein